MVKTHKSPKAGQQLILTIHHHQYHQLIPVSSSIILIYFGDLSNWYYKRAIFHGKKRLCQESQNRIFLQVATSHRKKYLSGGYLKTFCLLSFRGRDICGN